MTDKEDIILDQLYFVTAFHDIHRELDLSALELSHELWRLIEKGWVKCFSDPETEIKVDHNKFTADYGNYHYLASKQGLLEHNRR